MKKFTFRRLLNHFLNRIGRRQFSHLSICKTVLTNFRALPFIDALKFPIFIYSDTKIYWLKEVTINGPIERGMIRIGHHRHKAIGPTRILGFGKYIFEGRASIWGGCTLENHGTIVFGKDFSMAESCIILCDNLIEFGPHMSIGFKNTFIDSSFHFLLDTKRRMTFPISSPIRIGGGTWITSDCKIMQGACLPPNSTLIANSVLKSDFSDEQEGQMYGGDPAKKLRSNIRRVFDRTEEKRLADFFKQNPAKAFVKVKYDDEDVYCLNDPFKYE